MKMRARARHTPGEMNGLESRFSAHLNMLQVTGQIASWRFEAVKLRLAKKTWYTPDFWAVGTDGSVTFYEVKGGYWESDARDRIKIAAETFFEFAFTAVTFDRKKGWVFETFTKEAA